MQVEPITPSLPPPIQRHARTPGIHLSSVIRALAMESGLLKKDVAEDLSLIEVEGSNEEWWARLDEASMLRVSIGLAWEEWYIPQLRTVTDHPGELCVDGIYMTPDGESLDVILHQYTLCLHEVKATYKSINTVGSLFNQSCWMWLAQLRAYCKAMNTRIAFLHVLFLCGDYSYPIRPALRIFKVTFTQQELDENWDVMTAYVRFRQLQDERGV